VNFGDDVGNLVQSGAQVIAEGVAFLNDAGAALHIFDGLSRFALDALNQVGNFLGGLGGLFGQFAHFIGDDGKAKAMLASASRFDGRVKSEKVCLFGEGINDFDNFADVVGAMAENADDFGGRLDRLVGALQAIGGLFAGLNSGDDFFARAVSDIEQNFGGIGDSLDGSNHLIYGSGSFRDAGSLNLRVLDDV